MNDELDAEVDPEEDLTIAVDSTSIRVSNRGEWIRRQWKQRRGFIKIHLAVDVKTKQIVSMKVTKENIFDGRMLKPVVEQATTRAHVTKVLADGANDSKDKFCYLDGKGIEPVIKVRSNSSMKAHGCMLRKLSAMAQLNNYQMWRKKHGYGLRWMAESAISSLKRTFGESIVAIKWGSIVNELLLKASIYNLFISMNPS